MTHFIFMNHRIREPNPSGPVIVVQTDGEQREANEFELRFRGQPIGRVKFTREGLSVVETHSVHAWVELDDDVEVVAVAKAARKKSNRKVRT